MRLCVSGILLLVWAQTWTEAFPSQDHHDLDHNDIIHYVSPQSKKCSKFSSPLSLKDNNLVLGKFHFLAGFTDNRLYRTLLQLTSSFWFNITNTQTGLGLTQMNRMNGTCVESKANVTISEDTATFTVQNITSVFQFVNISSSLMTLNITASSSNISSFIEKLHLDPSKYSPDLSVHSVYLMGKAPMKSA